MVLLYLRYCIAVIAGGNFNLGLSDGLSDGLFAFNVNNAVGVAGSSDGVCAIKSTIGA